MAVLLGTIMEGKGLALEAKAFYEQILSENESDVVRLVLSHIKCAILTDLANPDDTKATHLAAPTRPTTHLLHHFCCRPEIFHFHSLNCS